MCVHIDTRTDTPSPLPLCHSLFVELRLWVRPLAYMCVRISAKADPVLAALSVSLSLELTIYSGSFFFFL